MISKEQANTINGVELKIIKDTVAAIQEKPELGQCKFRATNTWVSGGHNCTCIAGFFGGGKENAHEHPFNLDADEPPILAGHGKGAGPTEHLLNALAACLTTSMVYHAALKGIKIVELKSELEGDLDLRGFLGLSKDVRKGYQAIRVKFKVKTDGNDLDSLRELTKFSPVFDTISNGTNVEVAVEEA